MPTLQLQLPLQAGKFANNQDLANTQETDKTVSSDDAGAAFSALLNNLGSNSNPTNSGFTDDNSLKNIPKFQDQKPDSYKTTSKSDFYSSRKTQDADNNKKEPAESSRDLQKPEIKKSDRPEKPEQNLRTDDNQAKPVADTKQASDNSNPKDVPAKTAVEKSSDTEGQDAEKTSTRKSQNGDVSITSLLAMITNFLAGNPAANQQAYSGDDMQQDINPAQDAVGGINLQKINLLLQKNPEAGKAILADIKQNLANLQDLLKNIDSTSPTLSDAQLGQLSQINAALAKDLQGIKDLFANAGTQTAQSIEQFIAAKDNNQEPAADPKITPASAGELADVHNLLGDDIAKIKDLLQKFISNRVETKSTAQNDNAKPAANDGLKTQIGSPVVFGDANPNANTQNQEPAHASGKQDIAPATPLPTPVTTQQNQNTSAANIVQAVASEAHSDTGSNSSFSGGGQNQQPQFSIGGISGGMQQRGISNTSEASFSHLLNRPNQANGANIAEQVVFHVKSAVGTGNSKITIELNPEELGKLDISLDVDKNGKTGVTITADNKNTLDLLQRDSRGLEKLLNDAGLKADSGSLNFNLRGGQGEGGHNQNQSQAASQYRKSQPDEEALPAPIPALVRSYVVNIPDGLDIKI